MYLSVIEKLFDNLCSRSLLHCVLSDTCDAVNHIGRPWMTCTALLCKKPGVQNSAESTGLLKDQPIVAQRSCYTKSKSYLFAAADLWVKSQQQRKEINLLDVVGGSNQDLSLRSHPTALKATCRICTP